MRIKENRLEHFIKEDWNRKLIIGGKINPYPRIVHYKNNLDFSIIKCYRNNYSMFLSVNVGGLKLDDLGYNDTWSKGRKAIEQFSINLTENQIFNLYKELKEILLNICNNPKKHFCNNEEIWKSICNECKIKEWIKDE